MSTAQRTWTNIGARFEPQRAAIEREIVGLTWKPPAGKHPMMPGLGIQECIQQLRLPRVTAIAYDGAFTAPDPSCPAESAHYAVYGIEANYSNGTAHVYVVDTGTELLPVCSELVEERIPLGNGAVLVPHKGIEEASS